jgi:hypothetical protein
MTDPFDALREPVTPVNPDQEFAGRLRRRLTREVIASPGGTMSNQTVTTKVERQPGRPSRPRLNGSGLRAATRANPGAIRTVCSPSASTIRARRSASSSRPTPDVKSHRHLGISCVMHDSLHQASREKGVP